MNTGLRDADLHAITKVLSAYPQIVSAVLFGSRAKETYKKASDVDIALFGDAVSRAIVAQIHGELEDESPVPYFFDVVNYSEITNEQLKEHIARVGITIYKKEEK